MKTYVSLHEITAIVAVAPGSLGAPLVLQLYTDDIRRGDVTLFLDDQALVERLVTAINKTFDTPTLQDVAAEDAEIAAREAEKRLHGDDDEYDYAADDMAFDAAREARMFKR